MKVWLGVIGRACVEFSIILLLISIVAGISHSLVLPESGMRGVYGGAASAALTLAPLAALITLFLAFFSFQQRVETRIVAWLGLLLLGALLFSIGIGLRRLPIVHDAAILSGADVRVMQPLPIGIAVQQGREAVLIGSYAGGWATDAAAVDFGSDYPRLAYSTRADIDFLTGEMDIQGRLYPGALPRANPKDLVPEATLFAGAWIWDRLAGQDGLLVCFAAAGGFLLLAIGLSFLCRITGWPLANALLAAAALASLVLLDAWTSNSDFLQAVDSLFRRLGLPLWGATGKSFPGAIPLAVLEAFAGLVLSAIDLATAPRARRRGK